MIGLLEDRVNDDDEVIELDNGKFVVDGMSIMYLIGPTVDYKREVFGSYSYINPQAQVVVVVVKA